MSAQESEAQRVSESCNSCPENLTSCSTGSNLYRTQRLFRSLVNPEPRTLNTEPNLALLRSVDLTEKVFRGRVYGLRIERAVGLRLLFGAVELHTRSRNILLLSFTTRNTLQAASSKSSILNLISDTLNPLP